ncbi:hypothetical protein BBG03_03435 [Streptococcus dysgalactiae subsp. equisimilis]|nr:hypothetical protein BBG03_03435 [Streptococcus dysgalactiae subsp. equisimilis]
MLAKNRIYQKTVGSLPVGSKFLISNHDYGLVKFELVEKNVREKYCWCTSLTEGIRGPFCIPYDCHVVEVL